MDNEQVAHWYPRLFRTALRLTNSADDAADLTQQAFCKAIEKWHSFAGRSLPTTWLHRILINCIRDWIRRKSARPVQSLDEWELPAESRKQPNVVEKLQKDEQMAALRKAIEELPSTTRPAFVATVLDGYSYQEAAELLDVSVGTVASRVSSARKKVCEHMRAAFPEA